MWIRASDSWGLRGPDALASLQVTTGTADRLDPDIGWLLVSSDPTDGAVEVTLRGMVDGSTTGNSSPALVEYYLNGPGLTGTVETVPLRTNRATARFRTAVDLSALDPGRTGVIYVRAMDIHGNWGPLVAVSFRVTQ